MKASSPPMRWFQVVLTLVAAVFLARVAAGKSLPQSDGGLQISVNTAAYRVYAGEPDVSSNRGRAKRSSVKSLAVRDTLVASVHLANRSSEDLTFSFPEGAESRFVFRVFDSAGEEVWSGGGATEEAVAQQTNTAVLRKRSKWSSVVRIPLQVNGVWLSPGRYTLAVELSGEPKIGATTLFEIAVPPGPKPPEPPKGSGIKGQVFAPTANNELVVAPGARITVEELVPEVVASSVLRTRFYWTGTTNEEGRFEVPTPPGRFRVAAEWSENKSEPGVEGNVEVPFQIKLPLRASKEVQVLTGKISEVRLDLKPNLVEIGNRPVASVSSVKIRYLPTFAPPTMIEVSAEGQVNTGGWSGAQLKQRQVTPDGIIEFDFVAKPPAGPATQAFTSISASTNVPQPSNFRGVRVFGARNSVETLAE